MVLYFQEHLTLAVSRRPQALPSARGNAAAGGGRLQCVVRWGVRRGALGTGSRAQGARLPPTPGLGAPLPAPPTPPTLVGMTSRRPPAARATERYASGAGSSRSDVGAKAVPRRLQAVVRPPPDARTLRNVP